jgi:hypothetical protein
MSSRRQVITPGWTRFRRDTGFEAVRVHDTGEFLERVATGLLLRNWLEVILDRAVLGNAGEGAFDLLDLRFGKQSPRHSVTMLAERGFHFLQIDGFREAGLVGVGGDHRKSKFPETLSIENGRSYQNDG